MPEAVVRAFERMQPRLTDVGLLLMRIFFGGMLLVGHGWGKLRNFPAAADQFPDPLGIGHTASMAGAVLAEAVCAALVIAGLLTRVAAIPVVFSMAVAVLAVHAGDPVFLPAERAKEPALVYLLAFAVLILLGPGRFSLDHLLVGRAKRS